MMCGANDSLHQLLVDEFVVQCRVWQSQRHEVRESIDVPGARDSRWQWISPVHDCWTIRTYGYRPPKIVECPMRPFEQVWRVPQFVKTRQPRLKLTFDNQTRNG